MKDSHSGSDMDPLRTRISLVGKIRDQQNESAWTEFVVCYRKYLYNFILHMGFSHYDAEEIVQIALIKIWDAMPDFNYQPEKGRFRAWLCTIAGNTAKNFIRSKGGSSNLALSGISLDKIFPDSESEIAHLSTPPEVEAMAEEEWLRYLPELALKKIESKFDRRTMQAFTLCSKGVPVAEIARKLQLAPSSVYVYKQRVAERLTEEIAKLKKEFS